MFSNAVRDQKGWTVSNGWGHELTLPVARSFPEDRVRIGVFGTRARSKIRKAARDAAARMFCAMRQPLYVIDVRRSGVGSQSTWGPYEFGTHIPRAIEQMPYSFLHLPTLAPSPELLESWRSVARDWRILTKNWGSGVLPNNRMNSFRESNPGWTPQSPSSWTEYIAWNEAQFLERVTTWEEFRRRYDEELDDDALRVGQAFVEAAAASGGMAVFVCAEEDQPDFDDLELVDKFLTYCHRFTLARRLAARVRDDHEGVDVELVHLELSEFQEQERSGESYSPRTTPL